MERVVLEALFNEGNSIGGIAAVNEGRVLRCFSGYPLITGDNRGVVENVGLVDSSISGENTSAEMLAFAQRLG